MKKPLEKTLQNTDVSPSVLQALADNNFDSVLVTGTTKAGEVIYANKSSNKLAAYTQSEVIGKAPRILQGPITDKKVVDRLKETLRALLKVALYRLEYSKHIRLATLNLNY
jgi:transcriptional regulator with PAS, ATPase and Fis domain